MKSIEIAGRKIGPDFPPYTIAEISANHNGSIDNAFKLIAHAKDAGADAVKIQSYTADTITLNSSRPEFRINSGLWEGKTLYQLYEQAHLPWDWHRPLFDYARSLGITIFSSPFDSTAVDLLESLDAPAYKIASFEAIDLPLIKYVASMGKPMIISTGMANEREIEDAVNAATQGGCKDLALLHCVSGYPAPSIDYNLKTIPDLAGRFSLVTGLSDHTIDNTTAIAATAPLAALVAAAVRRRRAHRDANPHLVRASAARGRAARRLEEDGPVADRVLDAMCGLVAARMHRTDGALTARETIELAERTGLDADRLESLREILNAAEAARYAPGSSEDDRVLIERARELLPALDRLRPAGGRR